VADVQASYLQRLVEPKNRAAVGVEQIAYDDCTVIPDRNEAIVERGVELWREKNAVVDVQPLSIGLAICPTFDVAGAEERGHSEPGYGAAFLPILKEAVAKDVLPDTLNDEPLSLC